MMHIDYNAHVNMIGMLYDSGGVQLSKGMQVIGTSITYDSNIASQISSLGTQITGPLSLAGNITGTNATQTTITCPMSLVLTQTGDISGSTSLAIQSRGGLRGIQISTSDPTLHVSDFVLAAGASV